MLSLAAAIASPEAIVQAKPNHVEAIVEGCVERRGACWRAAAAEGGDGANGNSCESHCFGAQIDKLIFDLRTPMLVKQPFRSAASSPTRPGLCRRPRKTQSVSLALEGKAVRGGPNKVIVSGELNIKFAVPSTLP
jgi:hypothetical protein